MVFIELYKEIFKECISSFDFVDQYMNIDSEYRNRDYNTLVKSKVSTSDVKKPSIPLFNNYKIYVKDGGIYMERHVEDFIILFFFKFNGNILQPYYNVFFKEKEFDMLVNFSQLTSGAFICKYLLGNPDYPIRAKLFSTISELLHLIKGEVSFFEKFTDYFLETKNTTINLS